MRKVSERPPTSLTRRIGLPEHFQWLDGIVKALLVLNLIDAIMTLVWVYSRRATEANPFLEDLAHNHPVLFVGVKFALVSLGSYLLWRFRKEPLAVMGIFFAFVLYYAILLVHLRALNLNLLSRLFG